MLITNCPVGSVRTQSFAMTKTNCKLHSTIPGCIIKLQDAHLVSSFQNYFGIHAVENLSNGNDKLSSQCLDNLQNGVTSSKHSITNSYERVSKSKDNQITHTSYEIRNLFWYYVFSFGTSLGYELFYASFFPFWVWNLNSAVCRRVINIWVFVMYIGQVLKDIICWPRPFSPPVVHLEPKYAIEYGMPSTHAMVGVALPFSYWYFSAQRYDYPVSLGLAVCLVWCILVSCSRLYMGMHTVLDIIAGLLLAPILMATIMPFSEAIDSFQQTSIYSPLITTIVMIFFQWLYPQPNRWSPARGDTSVILGTGTGFAFGSWLNHHLGYNQIHRLSSRPRLPFPSLGLLGLWLLRMTIGLSCILIFRIVLKKITCTVLFFIMKLDRKDPNSYRNPCVEIPSKYITYIGIGLVITFIGPALFQFLQIQRNSMYHEV